MKKLIRKWLGLKDTNTTYFIELKRKSKYNKEKEMELLKKLEKLADQYKDTSIIFVNNVDFSWKKETKTIDNTHIFMSIRSNRKIFPVACVCYNEFKSKLK